MNVDKENRPPLGTTLEKKKKKKRGSTPGRPRKTETQFFDIGKVGRKTGITLEDNGVRDEHGLEPIDNIFSSPLRNIDGNVASSNAAVQESSAPDVDVLLTARKTPRLPPPRSVEPKHTNIGSPKRGSVGHAREHGSPAQQQGQPPANRLLDFSGQGVHKSIESPSPFKPRHVIPRSRETSRQDPFASPEKPAKQAQTILEDDEDADAPGDSEIIDDQPVMLDNDDSFGNLQHGTSDKNQEPSSGLNKKRDRAGIDEVDENAVPPMQKRQRGTQEKSKRLTVHYDIAPADNQSPAAAQDDVEDEQAELDTDAGPDQGNKDEVKVKKPKKERARPTDVRKTIYNSSPSKLRRGTTMGPMDAYRLRAVTPFEDSGERVSRYGRNLIQPLKFWANETVIYENGEVAGVVRADEIEVPKRKVKKRPKKQQRGKAGAGVEEDVAMSILSDDWEEAVGVINGNVAEWDPQTQTGDIDRLIKEDVAFANSSITARPVPGSDFKFAKIMTLPFFGAGLVELPPSGTKRAKNARKMQMVFFVHQGKVMVEVGAATWGGINQFAISKGGVFVVPRGNNYAISNESSTTTAKIFFAQGCEYDGVGDVSQ